MVELNHSVSVMGFNVFSGSLDILVKELLKLDSSCVVNTINPHSYVTQKNDCEFRRALLDSDFLLPDGEGIVLAADFIENSKISKVSGYDFFYEVMRQLNSIKGKVFFLGSKDDVLEKLLIQAKKEFPFAITAGYSPEFKSNFDDDDIKHYSNIISQFSPDVVFVGLTAPKQEKMIFSLKKYSSPKIFSGIGAVFDFYAGTVQRPSDIFISLKLEWLGRLMKEPRRMWRRNFISTPIFLKDMLVARIKRHTVTVNK